MKSFSVSILTAVFVLSFVNGLHASRLGQDSTVKRVVKMLENMLDKSKADGDNDRELYAKYLCYCNSQKETKTKEIEELTTDISSLENKMEGLLASNGELSTQVAELSAAIAEKTRQIGTADKLQGDRESDYKALKKDLTDSIQSMKDAIKVLAEVGADQTLEEGTHKHAADHNQFMAGFSGIQKAPALRSASLSKLQAQIKEALFSAQAFLPEGNSNKLQSFLQAPFTGTYTSQSAEVMGILKNMRDTFKTNLADATARYNAETKAHEKFRQELVDARAGMRKLKKAKEGDLGDNDSDLKTARTSLGVAQKDKKDKEDFLDEMVPICEKKTKEYEHRNEMRANEDAAITEAIAILNRDDAFHAFQKVQTTRESFLQVSSVADASRRKAAEQILLQAASSAAGEQRSFALRRIAALIEADNPFEVVLAEIKKMIALIDAEGKTDMESWNWCNKEITDGQGVIKKKKLQIIALNKRINGLVKKIEEPKVGLKAMIDTTETDLANNDKEQKDDTQHRIEDNHEYQKAIANQVEAEDILKSAIAVLKNYYSQISLAQVAHEKAPEVVKQGPWTGDYQGQSDNGNKVLQMLDYILKETEKEEEATHDQEKSDQHDYEDEMARLKNEEQQLRSSLAKLQDELAQAEKDLGEARRDLKKTEAEKAAVERYLLEIKPGCDFILNNLDFRQRRQFEEKTALENARGKLKASAAYTTYTAEQHLEDLGDCKDICVADGEDQATCKACLAKVTVPGYCAGHPTTNGC